MDHSVSLRHIFLTQNQIVNQINIFFSAALFGLPLPVCDVDVYGGHINYHQLSLLQR